MGKLSKKIREGLIKYGLIPDYREDTLFLMSLAFIFLWIISEDLIYDFFGFFTGKAAIAIILIPIGIYFSVYNAFSNKRKSPTSKYFMLFFAIMINIWIGIKSGSYLASKTQGWLIIFPTMNIINSIFLIIFCRIGIINESSISDENTNYWEMALGTIILTFILYISHYVYKNYWAVSFSMAVAYATNFNKIIIRTIINRKNNTPEF